MALVAAVGALASPIEKKQNSEIDDVTILNYACKSLPPTNKDLAEVCALQ